MGINVYTQRWIGHFLETGIIKPGASILDLGPQDLYRYAPHNARELALMGTQDKPGGWYASVGFGRYSSVDAGDERSTYRVDLNLPWDTRNRWDVVHNGGTAEHVFNIGQVFKTVHDVLVVGGLALHVLPAAGEISHGFYNVHPQVYRDMAAANGYRIEALDYIADIDGVCLRMIGEPVALPRPLKDYCCAALRKVSDAPFVWPQQECGVKGAG